MIKFPYKREEIIEDLREAFNMINTSEYVDSLIRMFYNNGCKILDNTPTFETLQELINQEFDNFWSDPENREGNEKKGTYDKPIYFHGGLRVLKVPRDRLNKFKSEQILGYLKYSEEVINKIIISLSSSKISVSSIIDNLKKEKINVSREFVVLMRDNWFKIAEEIATQQEIPTKLHTVWVDTTFLKRIECVSNQWDAKNNSFYYVKSSTGEVIYTDKKYFYYIKNVAVARAYGRTRDSDKIYSLGFVIGETENEKLYHELFQLLKSRGVNEIEIITSDGHKSIPKAFNDIYKTSKHQLCLIHEKRELKKQIKEKSSLKELNQMFQHILNSNSSVEAESYVINFVKNNPKYEALIWKWLNNKKEKLFVFLDVDLGKEKKSYTTNVVESRNKTLKSFLKNKGPIWSKNQIKGYLHLCDIQGMIKY